MGWRTGSANGATHENKRNGSVRVADRFAPNGLDSHYCSDRCEVVDGQRREEGWGRRFGAQDARVVIGLAAERRGG